MKNSKLPQNNLPMIRITQESMQQGCKIIDEKFKLNADKVFLNNSTNVLSARDNVTIFNSDGSILKAHKIVADQELRNAIIEKNFLYLPSKPFNNKKII